jgi:hypothetical protein
MPVKGGDGQPVSKEGQQVAPFTGRSVNLGWLFNKPCCVALAESQHYRTIATAGFGVQ